MLCSPCCKGPLGCACAAAVQAWEGGGRSGDGVGRSTAQRGGPATAACAPFSLLRLSVCWTFRTCGHTVGGVAIRGGGSALPCLRGLEGAAQHCGRHGAARAPRWRAAHCAGRLACLMRLSLRASVTLPRGVSVTQNSAARRRHNTTAVNNAVAACYSNQQSGTKCRTTAAIQWKAATSRQRAAQGLVAAAHRARPTTLLTVHEPAAVGRDAGALDAQVQFR